MLAIGASVHDLDEGRVAVSAGADWLVAALLVASGSPPGRLHNGLAWVKALAASTTVPVIAIGGIQPGHASVLRDAGVHGVAVIRGIWDAPNAEQAATEYLSAYDDPAGE